MEVLKKVVKVLLIVFSVVIISCVLLIGLLAFTASQRCVPYGSSMPGHKNFDYVCY